jgi:RNA polymerase sigma-70 factor, ECF subfamily
VPCADPVLELEALVLGPGQAALVGAAAPGLLPVTGGWGGGAGRGRERKGDGYSSDDREQCADMAHGRTPPGGEPGGNVHVRAGLTRTLQKPHEVGPQKTRLPALTRGCNKRGPFGDWPPVGSNATVEDDRALLERLRAGDERAFEALVDRYDGALRRVARTFVRTDSSADEVVQETWLGVVRGLGAFEGRSSLRTWIFRILVNRARTRATRDARSLPFSALETDEGPAVEPAAFGADGRWVSAPARLDSDPETGLLSAELRQHLQQAIGGLSPDQRAVITLRDLVGLSASEVCDLLELSDVNQRVLLHRARARVRAALLPLMEVRE